MTAHIDTDAKASSEAGADLGGKTSGSIVDGVALFAAGDAEQVEDAPVVLVRVKCEVDKPVLLQPRGRLDRVQRAGAALRVDAHECAVASEESGPNRPVGRLLDRRPRDAHVAFARADGVRHINLLDLVSVGVDPAQVRVLVLS